MEKKNNKYTALLNVMKRELRRLVSRPLYLFCMVIAPLFCYIGTFIKYYKISQLIHTQSIAN